MFKTFVIGWAAWWESLPPEIAFLTALPFGVAAAALAGELFKRHLSADPARPRGRGVLRRPRQ